MVSSVLVIEGLLCWHMLNCGMDLSGVLSTALTVCSRVKLECGREVVKKGVKILSEKKSNEKDQETCAGCKMS